MPRHHLGAQQHLDALRGLDRIDQILRHELGHALFPQDHRDLGCIAGQMQRRLTGRIAAADHDHLLVSAEFGLAGAGTVVQACPEELVLVREVQSPVAQTEAWAVIFEPSAR